MQQEKTEQFSFALLNNNLNLLHRLSGAVNLPRLASRTPLLFFFAFFFPQDTGTVRGGVVYGHPAPLIVVYYEAGIAFLRKPVSKF